MFVVASGIARDVYFLAFLQFGIEILYSMNILIACDGVTQGRGGAERLAVWLANRLIGVGHRVFLFTADPLCGEVVYPLDNRVTLKFYTQRDEAASILALRSAVTPLGIDVAIVFAWKKMLLQWVISLNAEKIPIIASEHAAPDFIENTLWNREDRIAAFYGVSFIHFILDSYQSSVPSTLSGRVQIINNPIIIDASEPRKKDVSASKVLLSVGALHFNKQRGLLIDAFALLHERFPHWHLYILGEGEERKKLESQIAGHKLRGKVFLLGNTPAVYEYYCAADLFCIPSKSESFALALGEALAYGLPAVGFALCTGVNSLIKNGENGLLAPEMTAQSLADTLRILMVDDSMRSAMGDAAPMSVQRYSEDDIFVQWQSLVHAAHLQGSRPLLISDDLPSSQILQRCLERDSAHTYLSMLSELDEIYHSRAWKIVVMLRKIIFFLENICSMLYRFVIQGKKF